MRLDDPLTPGEILSGLQRYKSQLNSCGCPRCQAAVAATLEFNRDMHTGAVVWIWETLPAGPVLITHTLHEAFILPWPASDGGTPVVLVDGINWPVPLVLITAACSAAHPPAGFVTLEEWKESHKCEDEKPETNTDRGTSSNPASAGDSSKRKRTPRKKSKQR